MKKQCFEKQNQVWKTLNSKGICTKYVKILNICQSVFALKTTFIFDEKGILKLAHSSGFWPNSGFTIEKHQFCSTDWDNVLILESVGKWKPLAYDAPRSCFSPEKLKRTCFFHDFFKSLKPELVDLEIH